MAEDHVCRRCGHVGEPNWVHWEAAFEMDGGYTPRCTECNSITYTKKEWLKQDYSEKTLPVFIAVFLVPLALFPVALLLNDDLAVSLIPFWFIGLILTVIIFAIGERRFVNLHEDE